MNTRLVFVSLLAFVLISTSLAENNDYDVNAFYDFHNRALQGDIDGFSPLAKEGLKSAMMMSKGLFEQFGGSIIRKPKKVGGGSSSNYNNNHNNGYDNNGKSNKPSTKETNAALFSFIKQISAMLKPLLKANGGLSQELMHKMLSLLKNIFEIFGSLTKNSQRKTGNMYGGMAGTFRDVMEENLNLKENSDQVQQEIHVAGQLLQSRHDSSDALIQALKNSTPLLSRAWGSAFLRVGEVFHKGIEQLDPETKDAVMRMHAIFAQSKDVFSHFLGSFSLLGGKKTKNTTRDPLDRTVIAVVKLLAHNLLAVLKSFFM